MLVLDDRLNCSDKIKYQVTKGGQNVVTQQFQSISQSSTRVVFNCVIPSLETIVAREVLWSSTVTLQLNLAPLGAGTLGGNPTGRDVTGAPAANATHGVSDSQFAFAIGVDSALAAFPLHSLCSTMSCTINNNTVTQNMQDTLPLILRMLDSEEMAKWSAHTPTTLDFLAQYRDAIQKMEFELGIHWNKYLCQTGRLFTNRSSIRLRGARTTYLSFFCRSSLSEVHFLCQQRIGL